MQSKINHVHSAACSLVPSGFVNLEMADYPDVTNTGTRSILLTGIHYIVFIRRFQVTSHCWIMDVILQQIAWCCWLLLICRFHILGNTSHLGSRSKVIDVTLQFCRKRTWFYGWVDWTGYSANSPCSPCASNIEIFLSHNLLKLCLEHSNILSNITFKRYKPYVLVPTKQPLSCPY